MKKQNVRTISLIVCTLTYLLIGAAIFDALESENELKNAEVLQEMEQMIIGRYGIRSDDYRMMELIVLKGAPHYAGRQWKFAGAFYYATTVLTTIGYGHSTPHTVGGKLFTMVYALVGIPLGLVMFQSIGERLNNFSSFVIRNAKRMLKYDDIEASETNLIMVVTTLSTITISGGAAAFSKYEGWTYFDSIYYCFVTLTTIGFGDMVALQQDNALTDKPEYVAFVLVFILFGLAIVAACLNLLVLRLVTLNTEDERRDEAAAVKAAQGAVRLDGDVITANGSILSGQIAHQHGGGSLINLDDSKSVCSCSCQCHGCLPWLPLSLRRRGGGGSASGGSGGGNGAGGNGGRVGASKTRPLPSDYAYSTGRGPAALSSLSRSYGALSSAATYSAASIGCDNETYIEKTVSERDNQGEYYELQNSASVAKMVQMRSSGGGVVYSTTMTSPSPSSRICFHSTSRATTGGVTSPTPDRVLARRLGLAFNFRSLNRRLRSFRHRVFSSRPVRQRGPIVRSRKTSLSMLKQRSVVPNSTAAAVVSAATALAVSTMDPSTTEFVDIPLDDNTFLNWSMSALSEKRASV